MGVIIITAKRGVRKIKNDRLGPAGSAPSRARLGLWVAVAAGFSIVGGAGVADCMHFFGLLTFWSLQALALAGRSRNR